MSNLLKGQVGGDIESDDHSEDDEKVSEPSAPKGKDYGGAHVRGVHRGTAMKGRGPVGPDPRKYKYDVVRGKAAKVAFEVTRDDRMSAVEAGNVLHSIHAMFGVGSENEDFLHAFDSAMWFCHTVNGGSVLQPGRSTFCVPGRSTAFDMDKVRDKLGNDMRRFFRAYADDIVVVNKRVLDEYDPYDPISAEAWGWLQQVAYSRGLHRFPHLAHDSADACNSLSPVERAALASSKVMVISSVTNSADRLRANDRATSADGYDSTLGTASN